MLYLFQQYDEKYLGAAVPQRGHEKKKKEAFKKLVQDVIGVNSFVTLILAWTVFQCLPKFEIII